MRVPANYPGFMRKVYPGFLQHASFLAMNPDRHATAHFHATRHPVVEGYDAPEGWGWCYVDELFLDLGEDTTPQLGPIPRYV